MEIKAEIMYNDRMARGYFKLGLACAIPEVKPGQFVMLRVSDGLDPLLRRPFGIYRMLGRTIGRTIGTGSSPSKRKGIEILYRVVGKGTAILSERRPGETLGVLGPLGNGFPDPAEGSNMVLVAGGMGIAPLYLLAKRLGGGTLLFGARSKAETALLKDFRGLGLKIKTATEDGSAGVKGLVTGLLEDELTPESIVYACGPVGMLKAAAAISGKAGARCLVSLERSMACGIGVCLGCAVRAKAHKEEKENRFYKMVCSDGPVFPSEEIDWDLL
ncbi:MAG: dihydroorotate dehydrogenase electron transfer subunit [Candidatus Methylomirabilis sp.]|nr:dihydroorotate dehydrogenase electron transfer subunit [Deltaproteobacteria bacterium]